MELAHANRVTTMGELAASIAHEINQPLAGVSPTRAACDGSAPIRPMSSLPRRLQAHTSRRRSRDRGDHTIARAVPHGETVAQPVDLNEVTREVLALASNELNEST